MGGMDELYREIRACRRCRLWKTAHEAVPGEGPVDADAMLVGQNPCSKEDETGRPFVGRAGEYLDSVLEEYGMDRGELYITSVVKHKTPNNRKQRKDEIKACMPFLRRQLEEITPKHVLLMGRVAWETSRLDGIRYVETYHPAAAMRFPEMEERFKKDVKEFAEAYHG